MDVVRLRMVTPQDGFGLLGRQSGFARPTHRRLRRTHAELDAPLVARLPAVFAARDCDAIDAQDKGGRMTDRWRKVVLITQLLRMLED